MEYLYKNISLKDKIGTNNGNDVFRDICKRYKPNMIVLVEPNKNHIESIKNNYSYLDNVNIFSNAIYYEDDKDIELYIPAMDCIFGTPGENGITYSDTHTIFYCL